MPKRSGDRRPKGHRSSRIALHLPNNLLAWIGAQAELLGTSRSKTITAWLEAARKAPSVNPLAEEDCVAQALIEAGGNVTTAARRLCLARGTLRYWIQEDGLQGLVEDPR